jgi:hypothetical protein
MDYMMLARALRDLLARRCDPHSQRPTIKMQKSACQNLTMVQSYEPRKILLPAFICLDFPNMAIPSRHHAPYCGGLRRRPGRQAHGSTGLAPRHHVRCPSNLPRLVNTSRKSLVRNNERYSAFSPAVSEAFLEASDPRTQILSYHL